MRAVSKAGIMLGSALAMGSLMYGIGEAVNDTVESRNPTVEQCAGQLGPLATDAAVLPADCQTLEQHFSYRYTETHHFDATKREFTSTQTDKIYELPAAVDFRKQNLFTSEEADRNTRADRIFIGIGAFAGGWAGLLMAGEVEKIMNVWRSRRVGVASQDMSETKQLHI
jgi:hypothetical protein